MSRYTEHRTLETGPLLVADSTMESGERKVWLGAGGMAGCWVRHAEFRTIVAALVEFAGTLPPSGVKVRVGRIQLSRAKGWRMPPNTVKVSRPGPYGNPFTTAAYFDAGWSGSERVAAQHCVDAYRALLEGRTHWGHPIPMTYPVPDLAPLRGKNLACWCKPGEPCHADVLLELANAPCGVPEVDHG